MKIVAIDPGPIKSAYVILDDQYSIQEFGIEDGLELLWMLEAMWRTNARLAIEMVASYGMPVGKDIFETCVWIGRFIQVWDPRPFDFVYRLDVKMSLCHNSRANDANIRQAIIDRFPATGGGAIPQIGTKKKPGPLYGMKKDLWSALGVALTAAELFKC